METDYNNRKEPSAWHCDIGNIGTTAATHPYKARHYTKNDPD